jgi:hypothetical protein
MTHFAKADIRDVRKQARERGENVYYAERPCRHGHNSPRYVSDTTCVECAAIRAKTNWPKRQETHGEIDRKRWRQYREQNHEKIRDYNRSVQSLPRRLAAQKKWRETHRDYDLARRKAYRAANGDALRARENAKHAANRDARRARDQANRDRNRDRHRAVKREWSRNNPEKVAQKARQRRARQAGAVGKHTPELSDCRRRRRLHAAAARGRAPGRGVPGLRRPCDVAALRGVREGLELGLRGVSGWRRRHPPGREGRGLRLPAAIERLGGRREIDAAQARRLFEAREKKRLARDAASDKFREAERKRLWKAWSSAQPIHGSVAEAYLAARGLVLPQACPGLRFNPHAPYFHGEQVDGHGRKSPVVLHKGPAMLAAFIRPDGKFGGLHTTYLAAGDNTKLS